MSTIAQRSAADLAKFFRAGQFPGSVAATYTPSEGDPKTVSIILDGPYQNTQVEGTSVVGKTYFAIAQAEDVEDAGEGDQIEADGLTLYLIGPVEEDGNGMVRLVLSEDQPQQPE